jgi:hypothetical protein
VGDERDPKQLLFFLLQNIELFLGSNYLISKILIQFSFF